MTDKEFVLSKYESWQRKPICREVIRKRKPHFQIVRESLIGRIDVGGVCKTEAAAWASAAKRIRKEGKW